MIVVYKITYLNGRIYVGHNPDRQHHYLGSASSALITADSSHPRAAPGLHYRAGDPLGVRHGHAAEVSRSSWRCSASTAPTTRRSATTGGRDRAWHRTRAESTLRPVQVAGSRICHGGPDSSAGRQAGKLAALPAVVR